LSSPPGYNTAVTKPYYRRTYGCSIPGRRLVSKGCFKNHNDTVWINDASHEQPFYSSFFSPCQNKNIWIKSISSHSDSCKNLLLHTHAKPHFIILLQKKNPPFARGFIISNPTLFRVWSRLLRTGRAPWFKRQLALRGDHIGAVLSTQAHQVLVNARHFSGCKVNNSLTSKEKKGYMIFFIYKNGSKLLKL
jgi:hypothetical protein